MAGIIAIAIGVALCAIAAIAWRARRGVRIAIFVAALVACVVCYWVLTLLPFQYISLAMFVLPVGPLLLFIVGLFTRHGVAKGIGVALAILFILSYSYVIAATRMSHASYPIEGVMHLPTFLKGQGFVRDHLNDPGSATFKDLRLTTHKGNQYMCGEVNARNRMGGLVGYTRFYVRTDEYFPFPFFDTDGERYDQYKSTCYGDD